MFKYFIGQPVPAVRQNVSAFFPCLIFVSKLDQRGQVLSAWLRGFTNC